MNGIDAIEFQHGHAGGIGFGNTYLRSPKRLYFGQLNADGKFVVYRGSDPEHQHEALWSTDSSKPADGSGPPQLAPVWQQGAGSTRVHLRIYTWTNDRVDNVWESGTFDLENNERAKAVLDDDGNFCVYKVTDDHKNPRLWQSGHTDPAVDYDITGLEFDIKAAKFIGDPRQSSIDSGTAENQSDKANVPLEIGATTSTAITSGWSDSLAIKVGVKSTFKTGIPFVGEGTVEVSLETTNTYTWNGSTSDTRSFTWKVSPSAGPWERARAVVTCTTSTIEVPYSLNGDVIFKSGKRMTQKVDGIYTGTNSHNVKAVYTMEKIPVVPMKPITQPHTAPAAQITQTKPIAVTVNYTKGQ